MKKFHFKRMKLRGRFITAFTAVVFVSCSLSIISISTYNKLKESYLELENVYVPSLASLMEMRIALEELMASVELGLDTAGGAKKASAAAEKIERNRDIHSAFLHSISDSDSEKKSLHNIDGEIGEIVAVYAELTKRNEKSEYGNMKESLKDNLASAKTQLDAHLDVLIAAHKTELKAAEGRFRAAHAGGIRMIAAGTALNAVLAVALGLYMARTVLSPLISMRHGVRIIGAGNLDYRLNVKTGDEIEQLADDFNSMSSHLKEYQERLVEVERRAAVGQAMAQILHGVKNILNAFAGGRYMINTALEKDKKELLLEGWSVIETAISRMSELSSDILDFSRGKSLNVKNSALNQLVDEVSRLAGDSARKLNIKIEFVPCDSIPELQIDEKAIHSAIMNIVSNAIDACRLKKYSKGISGEIMLRTFYNERTGTVCMEIKDNGIGMSEEVMAKIFTPFYSTKYSEGTGLGLPVSLKIIQDHGGRTRVESEVGKGSIFTLEFPVRRDPQTYASLPVL